MDISIVFYLPLSPSYSFYLLSKLFFVILIHHLAQCFQIIERLWMIDTV